MAYFQPGKMMSLGMVEILFEVAAVVEMKIGIVVDL